MNGPDIQSPCDLAIFGSAPVRARPIETVVAISAEARSRVSALMDSGKLSDYYNGPWAHRLEHEFAALHGPDYRAVAVNSGTSALHLAVTAAGIGAGDEVIVPALCFVAAANAVVQNGAIPVICDAEPHGLTLDTERVEALIGPRTRAVLAVHFWGYPSNSTMLRALCDRHGLTLIEDCAQAFGARVEGHMVGTYGDYATYAFSIRKHVACGEGGVIVCRGEERERRVRRLSNYGKGPGWDDYDSLGYSYRLAEFPAIIALDGLARLDDEIAARQRAGRYYRELLASTPLRVVPEPAWGGSVFFKCPVLLPGGSAGARQQIVDAISAENVSCRIPHRPLYAIEWLAGHLRALGAYRGADACPVVAAHHARLIEIETGPHLPLAEAHVSGAAIMKAWRHFAR